MHVDISSKVNNNPRYQLSREDIIFFENKYGKITSHSFVIIYTGWSKFWENRDLYRNNLVFPTISVDAAKILVDRNIVGLGIDTLGPDLPGDEYFVHDLLLKDGKYIIENIANAQLLPAVGSFSFALPLKLSTTETPVRLIALIEGNKN